MFGPRSLKSSAARLAAELPTVLSNSSAGALVGPPRNSASRNTCVDCPPAVDVPSTTPTESSPPSRNRRCRHPRAPASSPRWHRRPSDPGAAASSAGPSPTTRKSDERCGQRRPAVGGLERRSSGAMPLRPSSRPSRNASCDVPNAETTPIPDTITGRRTARTLSSGHGPSKPRAGVHDAALRGGCRSSVVGAASSAQSGSPHSVTSVDANRSTSSTGAVTRPARASRR